MKQVILDTNAVRYFYQIECCGGEGVRDKVMKKYYFDKQKYIQFLRTVSSISIPVTTKYELFFQAYRKGEPDLIVKYNELTQLYKERYGIEIYTLNQREPELKFDEKQLAEDLTRGVIQTEKYIKPRIEHEANIMQALFMTLIGTLLDVAYRDLEIDINNTGAKLGFACWQMHSRLYDLFNQYYLNKEIKMSLDDVDKKIDEILLDSTRNAFMLMNMEMSREYPERLIEWEKVSYNASNTSEYLKVLFQFGMRYTENDYLVSLSEALNELHTRKNFDKTEIKYFRYLLQNAFNGTKRIVHKNDAADYAIITMLSEKVTLKGPEGEGKKEDLKLITFDKKMYEFSKQNNVMYDEMIYNQFLLEIR